MNSNSEISRIKLIFHNSDDVHITSHLRSNSSKINHCAVLRINSNSELKTQYQSNLERILITITRHRPTHEPVHTHTQPATRYIRYVLFATVKHDLEESLSYTAGATSNRERRKEEGSS